MQAAVDSSLPHVFSAAELARATRTSLAEVQAWIEAGAIRALPVGDGVTWLTRDEALRAGRAVLDRTIASQVKVGADGNALFAAKSGNAALGRLRTPLVVSSTAHVALFAALIVIASLGLGGASAITESRLDPDPLRLVYLALPGEGGGGGGGGLKQLAPPPKAQRKGTAHIDSPVPAPPPPPAPEPPKADPPPPPEPVKAPVAEVAASPETRDGQIAPAPPVSSRGSGDQGGVGTGAGTGIGEGKGPGIGEGDGGGTGGGPFRPGSGIEPPSIRHEVKPDYTEDARRRNIRGDVLMEIVVKRDGTVGDVRVLRGLAYGLDERAVEAVKQWSFNPATRKGVPVDVLVEVAMEFRLR
jgi:periplasmic protein TonB